MGSREVLGHVTILLPGADFIWVVLGDMRLSCIVMKGEREKEWKVKERGTEMERGREKGEGERKKERRSGRKKERKRVKERGKRKKRGRGKGRKRGRRKEKNKENRGKSKEKKKGKKNGMEKGKGKEKKMGKEKEEREGEGKGKEKGKGKGKWKEYSLRNVGRTDALTHGPTDTKVILYSVQCYALHWTDNNRFLSQVQICNVRNARRQNN